MKIEESKPKYKQVPVALYEKIKEFFTEYGKGLLDDSLAAEIIEGIKKKNYSEKRRTVYRMMRSGKEPEQNVLLSGFYEDLAKLLDN